MRNIAIVYWSGTGNTQQMAEAIAEGIQHAGAAAALLSPGELDENTVQTYDQIAFGCPSMGAEVLEETEFEPAFAAIERHLKDYKVALFGSYGWGDGQWMRDWQDRVIQEGAILFQEGLMCNGTPDLEMLENCRTFGKGFAQF